MYQQKYFTPAHANARKSFYNDYWYASAGEAAYAAELDLRKRTKDIRDWDRQIRIPLLVYGVKIGTYIVDFKIYHKDDTVEWVEYKGYPSELWKWKWRHFEAQMNHEHPEDKLTVVMHDTRQQFRAMLRQKMREQRGARRGKP